MKIRWHTPYREDSSGRYPDPVWPEDWPLPAKGSIVQLRGENALWVTAVDYYLQSEDSVDEPFIYIVLSSRPRS